jgi:hypothetical protein
MSPVSGIWIHPHYTTNERAGHKSAVEGGRSGEKNAFEKALTSDRGREDRTVPENDPYNNCKNFIKVASWTK